MSRLHSALVTSRSSTVAVQGARSKHPPSDGANGRRMLPAELHLHWRIFNKNVMVHHCRTDGESATHALWWKNKIALIVSTRKSACKTLSAQPVHLRNDVDVTAAASQSTHAARNLLGHPEGDQPARQFNAVTLLCRCGVYSQNVEHHAKRRATLKLNSGTRRKTWFIGILGMFRSRASPRMCERATRADNVPRCFGR